MYMALYPSSCRVVHSFLETDAELAHTGTKLLFGCVFSVSQQTVAPP